MKKFEDPIEGAAKALSEIRRGFRDGMDDGKADERKEPLRGIGGLLLYLGLLASFAYGAYDLVLRLFR